jgi:hypothetical protein
VPLRQREEVQALLPRVSAPARYRCLLSPRAKIDAT